MFWINKGQGHYQHGPSCWNKELEPKIGATIKEGAMEDQDCGWSRKGKAIVKDLWISDPTNDNIRIHNGSSPKELPLMQEPSGLLKTRTNFGDMEQLSKKKMCSKKSVNNY
jgi:hypothetical protein